MAYSDSTIGMRMGRVAPGKSGHRVDIHYILPKGASLEQKIRLACERAGTVLALCVFASVYLSVVLMLGFVVGLAVGWFPAVVLAWGAARLFIATAYWAADGKAVMPG